MRRWLVSRAAVLLVGGGGVPLSAWGLGGGESAAQTAVQTSSMPFDFDGDGNADLTVGVPGKGVGGQKNAGAVQVLYGSSGGPTVRDQLVHQNRRGIKGHAETWDWFGDVLASGDFDADGYADLAVGIPREGRGGVKNAGAVEVLYGGSNGLTRRDQLWHQDSAGVPGTNEIDDVFGASLAVGDFDGDGYADLAIGVPWETVGSNTVEPMTRPRARFRNALASGRVVVLRGSADGLTADGVRSWSLATAGMNDWQTSHSDASYFGWDLAAGDVNGDGRDDLAASSPGEVTSDDRDSGAAHVLYGGPGGLTITGNQYLPVGDLIEGNVRTRGEKGLALGDFTGDGRADLVLRGVVVDDDSGALSEALVVVYAGQDGLVASRAEQLELEDWNVSLATGDLNGDEIDDLAVGTSQQAASVLPGTAAGLVGPWVSVTQETPGIPGRTEPIDRFGVHVAILPLSGGTTDWLAIGVLGENHRKGRVVVIPGGDAGLLTAAAQSWSQDSPGIKGVAERYDNFGSVVGIGQNWYR